MPQTVQVIPDWFLMLATILMLIICGLFVSLMVVALGLAKTVKKVEGPVRELLGKVNNDLMPKVETLMVKVEVLTDKVNDVAENAKAISGTARGTVEKVSGGASSVTNSLVGLTEAGVSKLKSVAPYLGIAITVLKLIQEFRATVPKKKRDEPDDDDED